MPLFMNLTLHLQRFEVSICLLQILCASDSFALIYHCSMFILSVHIQMSLHVAECEGLKEEFCASPVVLVSPYCFNERTVKNLCASTLNRTSQFKWVKLRE